MRPGVPDGERAYCVVPGGHGTAGVTVIGNGAEIDPDRRLTRAVSVRAAAVDHRELHLPEHAGTVVVVGASERRGRAPVAVK